MDTVLGGFLALGFFSGFMLNVLGYEEVRARVIVFEISNNK